ncbi:MAG: tRNA lysidine(34) synthetase TilS [Alkalibacterium sp.]|nr:tRNA lysidine(34) synthetase TilS [Alkalibacterium sp.]
MAIYQDFVQRVKDGKFWNAKDKVIIAVSGGVDSIVLLDLVNRLPDVLKPDIVVAHVNHQLREASKEEALFVKTLAAQYRVEFREHQWDRETHPQSGLEQAARNIRYAFFKKLAEELNAAIVLTAHHKDDQVETILMRLVRGSSLDELKGIETVRQDDNVRIIRLLLPYSKSELISYAREQKLDWREDETNTTSDFTRNRYRQTIIPLLKKENPAVEDHIIRFSEEIRSVGNLMTPLIEEKRREIIEVTDQALVVERTLFLQLDPFMQEKVLANAVKEWSGNQEFLFTQRHLTLFRKWLESSGPNTSLDLPNNLMARRTYDWCTIEENSQQISERQAPEPEKLLKVGEWVRLTDTKMLGLLSYTDYINRESTDSERTVFLAIESSRFPLLIRHRKNGDRIRLKGLKGSKKVKDVFIDQKIPLKERDQAWIVTDNKGEIVWLVDYKESALSLDPITDTISYVLVYTDKSNFN